MKRMMALLLGCLLCLCAAGAMAEETAEIVLSHSDSWTYDIYPNGYTKTDSVTTEFIEHEGPYVINGISGPKDTPVEFHANAYDKATGKAKTQNGQNVSYDVTFDSLTLDPSVYSTAVRFGCDEGQATGCNITLKLRLSGTSNILTFGHPAFQYSFGNDDNTVTICVHNSSGDLTLKAGGSSEKLVGRNITLYANNKTITNKSTENKSNMTIDATISSPTNLIRVEGSPATCTADGIAAHWKCPRCGGLFTDGEGLIDTTLSAVTIPAPGHDLEKVPAKAPTYEQDGNIEHYRCKRCGALFSDANETQELMANDVVLAKLVRTDTLPQTDDLPQTGDSSRLTGWLALLGACCAGIWCLNRRRG